MPKESAVASKSKTDEKPEGVRMYAGHRDMVRYRSQDDENYKTVIYHLRELTENASEPIKQRWQVEHRINQSKHARPRVSFSPSESISS